MRDKINKLIKFWDDRDNQARYAKWLYSYSKPYLWKIILCMLFNIGMTGMSLWMAVISKDIINNAINGNGSVILSLVILYTVLVLGSQVLNVIYSLLGTMLQERFSFGIRKQVYDKILSSKWLDIQKYHSGDLMTRLTSDAQNIADGIMYTIPSIITLTVQLLMVFFTLFYYSKLIAVFALSIAPIAALMALILGRRISHLWTKVQETEAAYRSFMQESIANLMIFKTFANEGYASDRLVKLREDRFSWVFKRTKVGALYSTTMNMSFNLGYIVAFTYGAFQVASKVIDYGTMSIFLTLVNRVQSPVMSLSREIPQVISILASAGRVMEIEAIESEEKLPHTMDSTQVGINVEKVSFGYTDELVLKDIDLRMEPGQMVAVIGESGIGKTTLIRLVMSFMDVNAGHIEFFNKQGQTEIGNATNREFMSYVPQGNTLFSGTIRENIRMGRLDATEEEMWEALRMASADEFVTKLPHGLDTRIGEKGHGLSEGQAQRVAIARALIRRAPFLILDEATSALDEQTELKVLKGINEVTPKPTCLVITHRKSVLQYCDKEIEIVDKQTREVVNEGKIAL